MSDRVEVYLTIGHWNCDECFNRSMRFKGEGKAETMLPSLPLPLCLPPQHIPYTGCPTPLLGISFCVFPTHPPQNRWMASSFPKEFWYQAWPWHPFFYTPTCHHLYIYPPSWLSKFNLILVNKSSLNTYDVQGNVHRDEKASVSMQSSHFSRETTKMASPPGPTTVAMGICPWGLPCWSMAETLHSHCRRPEFSPWSGN